MQAGPKFTQQRKILALFSQVGSYKLKSRLSLETLVSLFAALWLLHCQSSQEFSWGDDVPKNFQELKNDLLKYDGVLNDFTHPGPFNYIVHEDKVIQITNDLSIVADFAKPKAKGKSPLVIISHGNRSAKEAHRYQIEHLASFGIMAISLQLPNRGEWLENGFIIARLVNDLIRQPKILSSKIDTKNIILVGHSFGGSAMSIAAGSGARAKGLVLLDPAVFNKKVKYYMQKVKIPAILLGADRNIYRARKQRQFFRYFGGDFAEISIANSTHDDAQWPSMFAQVTLGIDPYTNRERQRLFAAALTTSAFSLAATNNLKWAWQAFTNETKNGRLTAAKYRSSRQFSEPNIIQNGEQTHAIKMQSHDF